MKPSGENQREIRFGPFRLDPANARLLRDGRPVALTPKALDVLHYLASRPDRLVTKEELLSAVWPDVIVGDASVKVCVLEIRKALDDGAKSPQYIETVHRRGYRFIATVGDAAGEEAPSHARTGGGAARLSDVAETTSARHSEGVRTTTARPTGVVEQPAKPVGAPSAQPLPAGPRHPLVGRDAEMRRLGEMFARALAGQRQFVFVSGGPGTGKTVLVEAFMRQASDAASAGGVPSASAPLVLSGHCFEQFGTSEPYMPLWEAIGRLAGERSVPALATLVARHAAAYAVPAGAAAPTPSQPSPAAREPRAMSERMLREMADGLEALAAEVPVILLLEDVQWADYSTLDLISALARRRAPVRLMIIATYRPSEVLVDEHPLRDVAQELLTGRLCCELSLDFLNESAVAQYLAARFPGGDLPAALARRLHQRTDGHPLFLVHLVDDLIEQGAVVKDHAGGRWQLAGMFGGGGGGGAAGGAWLAVLDKQIPRTVRAMIEAQIERLGRPAQQALEAAAVAGVEFSAADVAAGLGGDVVQAEQVCEELQHRHRFLQERGLDEWPDGTVATQYRFVHELYHNVVYERIPFARRVRLHQTMGLRMETAWGDRAPEEAAELAMHFELGRDWARAVRYLRQAADSAGRQYAHREAVNYLRRALAALERLPAEARGEHELALLVGLGVNLQVTKGFAAPEVQLIHARAHALCQPASGAGGGATATAGGDVRATFPVLWGIWLFHKVRSDLRQANVMACQLLDAARAAGDSALLLQAHQAMCVTHLCLGNPAATADHMAQAAALYDPARHADNTRVFGQDPGVATLAFGSVALWLLGRADEALAAGGRSVELARRLGQPSSLALALHFAAMLHQCRGGADDVERFADETIDVATEEGFSFWLAGATVLRGWARATRGAGQGQTTGGGGDAGIAEIRKGLDGWLATGSRTYQTYYLGLLADALLRHGRSAEALPVIDQALGTARALPEGIYEAELYRLKGSALAGPSAAARDALSEALAVARRQGAKWFELRAAQDLAGMLADGGRAGGAAAPVSDAPHGGSDVDLPPPPPPPRTGKSTSVGAPARPKKRR